MSRTELIKFITGFTSDNLFRRTALQVMNAVDDYVRRLVLDKQSELTRLRLENEKLSNKLAEARRELEATKKWDYTRDWRRVIWKEETEH